MIVTFFVILITLLIQIQILPIFCLKLDLMALVTIYYGLLSGWKKGLFVGLIAGIFTDVFSGGVLGLSSFGLVICGVLAGYSKGMLLLRYWILRVSLVFVLTILNLCIYSILSVLFYGKSLLSIFNSQWLIISLGNAIVAAALFWIVDRHE